MIETLLDLKTAVDSAFAAIALAEVNANKPDDLAWDRIVDADRTQLCVWRESSTGRRNHVYCSLETRALLDLPLHAEGLIQRTCAKMIADMTRRPRVA